MGWRLKYVVSASYNSYHCTRPVSNKENVQYLAQYRLILCGIALKYSFVGQANHPLTIMVSYGFPLTLRMWRKDTIYP